MPINYDAHVDENTVYLIICLWKKQLVYYIKETPFDHFAKLIAKYTIDLCPKIVGVYFDRYGNKTGCKNCFYHGIYHCFDNELHSKVTTLSAVNSLIGIPCKEVKTYNSLTIEGCEKHSYKNIVKPTEVEIQKCIFRINNKKNKFKIIS